MDAAPPDTGTGVAVGSAPGVAVPVVAADPTTDMDVDTADDLFADVVDFDPTLAWGDSDEVTAAIPVWSDAEVTVTVKADAGVIVDGDASPGIDTRAAADAGIVAGGPPDRALGASASADAHGSATKERRRKQSRPVTRDGRAEALSAKGRARRNRSRQCLGVGSWSRRGTSGG